jgi:DNA helicase-2/ATP-dependent DNA helicase PcrA
VREESVQARYVADRVLANREAGVALKKQAVLFRTSHHSAALELELARRHIPFVKYGGLKFLEAAHVKDVIACLRFIENPRDRIAGFRALQLLPGIGPTLAGRALDGIDGRDLATALDAFRPPSIAADGWHSFTQLAKTLARHELGWPAELAYLRAWYQPQLERIHENAAVRLADLMQLEQIALSCRSREQFLTELTLDPPSATSDEAGAPWRDEDYLVLSTIHSAKGQEWRSVFLLNAVDGCIPSDLATGTTEEIEEERRLLYVAMTRARDQLELIVPQRFYVHQQPKMGDHYVHATRTRFVPASLLAHFEQQTWPAAAAAAANREPAPEARLDIGARLRAMWR